MAFETGGIPVALESGYVSLASGATAAPDLSKLQNSFRMPMVIDEVHFLCSGPASFYSTGGMIRARLLLNNRIIVTDSSQGAAGYVPLWNFGKSPSLSESVHSYFGSGNFYCNYRWRLPKPLYVPAGGVLACSFVRMNDGNATPVNVATCYLGRKLPDVKQDPIAIDVPYVLSFLAPEGTLTVITQETDVYNPFAVPLNVQRFTARVQYRNGTIVYESNNTTDLPTWGNTYANNTAPSIYIIDSYGHPITSEPVPLGIAMDAQTRSWTFQTVLQPGELFTFKFSPGADRSLLSYLTLMSSMVGHRQEAL